MNDKIKVRKLEKQDFSFFIDDKNHWGLKQKDAAWFEWLDQFNPSDRLSLVATLNDVIIGYYATITVPLKIEDRIVRSYRGGLFVHPDHRRKTYNVLNLLVRAVHDEARKREGVIYAFPISRLMKYYTHRIKFDSLKPIPRYVLVLRGGLFEPFRRRWLLKTTHAPKGVEIKEIHFFDERFDQLWEKASKTHKIIAMRDAEYLNWRYLKEPGRRFVIFAAERNHELLGYIILKPLTEKDRRIGSLIDIFDVQDKTVTKALFLQAVRYFAGEGADKLEFYLSDEYYETVLKSTGFVKNQDSPKAWEMLIAKSYSPGTEKNVFGNPRNWFITATDMIIA